MKYRIKGSLVMVALTMLAGPVLAEEGKPNWQQFKKEVKDTGREIGKTGKEVGLGVADGAKEGGKAVKELFSPSGKGGNSK